MQTADIETNPYKLAGAQPYEERLVEWLQADPREACAYLQECFADGHPQVFLMALRMVAQAYGGIGQLAEKSGLNRETLYRTLSSKGNPSLSTLTAILGALGYELTIVQSTRATRARRGGASVKSATATRKRKTA